MSSEALAWAIRCKVPKASLKNMLMVVSDLANHISGDVFASLAYYQDVTGLSKRTVLECLDDLVTLGVLEPTDERRGSTRQIVVYHFHMADLPQVPRWSSRKSGAKTHPLPKQVQNGLERGAVSDGEEVQNRTTEPSIGNQVGEDSPPSPDGEATPTGESDLFGKPTSVDSQPFPDYALDAWHRLKADEPRIVDTQFLTPSLEKKILARTGEVVRGRAKNGWAISREAVWDELCVAIRRSTFLCGRAPPGKGRTAPFKLTMEYALRPAEFPKILNGAYDDDERYRNRTGFDHGTGREYGAAEAAVRGVLDGLGSSGQFRAGRGDQGSADGRGPHGASGRSRALSR